MRYNFATDHRVVYSEKINKKCEKKYKIIGLKEKHHMCASGFFILNITTHPIIEFLNEKERKNDFYFFYFK